MMKTPERLPGQIDLHEGGGNVALFTALKQAHLFEEQCTSVADVRSVVSGYGFETKPDDTITLYGNAGKAMNGDLTTDAFVEVGGQICWIHASSSIRSAAQVETLVADIQNPTAAEIETTRRMMGFATNPGFGARFQDFMRRRGGAETVQSSTDATVVVDRRLEQGSDTTRREIQGNLQA